MKKDEWSFEEFSGRLSEWIDEQPQGDEITFNFLRRFVIGWKREREKNRIRFILAQLGKVLGREVVDPDEVRYHYTYLDDAIKSYFHFNKKGGQNASTESK